MKTFRLFSAFFLVLLASPGLVHSRDDPQNGVVTRRVIHPDGRRSRRRGPTMPRRPRKKRRRPSKAIKIIRRGELARWVKGMLERVKPFLSRAEEDKVDYRVKVIDHPSINAMALADGRIFLTKGLLKFVESDDELAAVICHECAHIEMKHHPKRSLKQMLWMGLAVLSAALTKAERAGFLGAQLLGNLATLSYGRNQEHEADRVGFELCERAGYNPTAMKDFIERLLEYEKKNSKFKVHPIFSSHPPTRARVRKIESFIEPGKGYAPKILTYDPGKLFYSPMQWSSELPGLGGPLDDTGAGAGSVANSRYLLAAGHFDHSDVFTAGWSVLGQGSSRIDEDNAAIGRASLKLWASGKGKLSLFSPPLSLGKKEELILEFLLKSEFVSS